MNSPSHLVEIDLLRQGLPIPVYGGIPPHEYLVHVSRFSRRPKARLWPIRLSQKLPPVRIPLKPADGSVVLDLQAVLHAAYDRAATISRSIIRPTPFPRSSPSGTPGRIACFRRKACIRRIDQSGAPGGPADHRGSIF